MTVEYAAASVDEHFVLVRSVLGLLFILWIFVLAKICQGCVNSHEVNTRRRSFFRFRSVNIIADVESQMGERGNECLDVFDDETRLDYLGRGNCKRTCRLDTVESDVSVI